MWSPAQNMCTPLSAPRPRRVGEPGGEPGALEEARGGDDAAPPRPGGVAGVAVQRVVVAEAVGVVTDPVAAGFLVPGRPPGVGPVDADLLPEPLDAVVGEPARGRVSCEHG